MKLGTAQIIQGNALNLPLPDSSVDLICTSPPYFGLRSYQDGCRTCTGSPDSYRVKTCSGCGETTSRVKCHNNCGVPMKWTKPESSVDPTCPDCGGTGKGHYDGQIGSEATPAEFLEALLAATREMVRVLKPTGSIFVNLGDKYSSTTAGGNNNGTSTSTLGHHKGGGGPHSEKLSAVKASRPISPGVPTKSLMGIPWRYAIRCIDQLGLILRAEIIWNKPNGLPESVTDRVRRSHEQWFHMVKQPRYYSAVDEIREEHDDKFNANSRGHGQKQWSAGQRTSTPHEEVRNQGGRNKGMSAWSQSIYNPLGKLPGSVWTIPTQPLTVPPELGVDHFAAYPMEWPRRIIQGWTPNGICTVCGEGRRPVKATDWDKIPHTLTLQRNRNHTDQERCRFGQLFSQWQDSLNIPTKALASLFPSATGGLTGCVGNWRTGLSVMTPDQRDKAEVTFGSMPPDLRSLIGEMEMLPAAKREMRDSTTAGRNRATGAGLGVPVTSITGYVCACPTPNAPTTPSVILDPFGGTGTTALVAKALGRTGITIDLSADYCRLAQWRCNDPRELAAALQVEKPDPVHPDQLDLFGEA